MRITAVCLATGRIAALNESVGSFLAQDHEDARLIIINTLSRQTIVFDHPKIVAYNVKQSPCLPMRAKNYGLGLVSEGGIVAWDESAIALPNFLSSIAAGLENKEWICFDKEYVFEAGQHLKLESPSEFSFAFSTTAFKACGPYQPGINGASDKNLISKITAKFPGEKTAVTQPNLIRIGSREERESTTADAKCGIVKLNPSLSRDWQALTLQSTTGKKDDRICVVELGRLGDIVNILPCLKLIADRYKKPHLMVSAEFAELLDGVTYVEPFVIPLKNEELVAATSIAKSSFSICLVAQIWGKKPFTIERQCRSYNEESFRAIGMLHHFEDKNFRPVFDNRSPERERVLVEQVVGDSKKPIILVNVTKAVSSPCAHCAPLLEEITKVWSSDYLIVNLAEIRAHRVYDLLALMELARCCVTLDTVFAHLAPATKCPVVLLSNPRHWAGTIVRGGNGVSDIPYDEVLKDGCRLLHESILAATQRDFGKI